MGDPFEGLELEEEQPPEPQYGDDAPYRCPVCERGAYRARGVVPAELTVDEKNRPVTYLEMPIVCVNLHRSVIKVEAPRPKPNRRRRGFY